MNTGSLITQIVGSFVMQLPILLVCLVAGFVVLTRWNHSPRASLWALLGFGLALALCFIIPIGQAVVSQWMMQNEPVTHRANVFSGLSILWALLRATTYALLLVAVFAGRSPSIATSR